EPTPEQPREVAVTVVSRGTDEPIAGAEVVVDGQTAATDGSGAATLTAMRGATVEVVAPDHDASEATVPDDGNLRLELRRNVARGRVTDAAGEPVAGARIIVDGTELLTRTDEDGRYELAG